MIERRTDRPNKITVGADKAFDTQDFEASGWGKEVGRMRRTRFRGLPRVGLSFGFTALAYNLVRLPKLLAA